ncbi:hypothetical protein [Litorimonas sp.]|uniref:hypothetical protein n=1 Tax=Litorimonas sp. TaxID=1892381 RepID=UPI003A88B453
MFDSIGKAAGYVKRLIKLKDDVELLEAVQPLQEVISEAQREATEAVSKIHELTVENIELKKEIIKLNEQKSVTESYKIHRFDTGGIVWKLKSDEIDGYPYICANCVEEGRVSPLQERGLFMSCNACKTRLQIKPQGKVNVIM